MDNTEVKMVRAIIQMWIDSLEYRFNWMKANYPDVEREFQDFRADN